MIAIGIIPARMGSSRFPGKPLAELLGMPMVGHCYHRTRLAEGLSGTYVATCDSSIAEYIAEIGGEAVMTASTHNRASTRTAEALTKIEEQIGGMVDVVVMVQGDEPLIPPKTISETLRHFDDPAIDIVNIMSPLRTLESIVDKNNVKVVVNQSFDALYFSREPIPSTWKGLDDTPRFMQTGIIAFRRDVLLRFNATEETPLEVTESVDLNRVLETGGKIRMVPIDASTIGVDTPEELHMAEQLLKEDPALKRYLQE